MAEIELKPCPFCGNEYVTPTKWTGRTVDAIWIECDVCGARSKSDYKYYELFSKAPTAPTEKERIEVVARAWNRRIQNDG